MAQTLTEVRTVHSRARTAWLALSATKKRCVDPSPQAYLARRHREYDRQQQRGVGLVRPTDEVLLRYYRPWTEDDDRALEKLDQVVRLLDEYALPKKRVYP